MNDKFFNNAIIGYEKLVAFIKDCESKCDVGNYAYTTELKLIFHSLQTKKS